MTRRGRLVLALGVAVYVVAWVFGSRALYPVAAGLVLAVAGAVVWVRLSLRPPEVHRHGAAREVFEGEDVRVDLGVTRTASLPAPAIVAEEEVGSLGVRRVELVPVGGRRLAGGYDLRAVPRGRYAFDHVRLSVQDPFGLAQGAVELAEPHALLVYPRLVPLERLFGEAGSRLAHGRRPLLQRTSGLELHGVRDHVEGESLRRVHWPSTARRGHLMVKEFDDAPRDEVAVVLDADRAAVAGSSFDAAVRAAGSLLRAHVRRGRRCVLALNSAARETAAVATEGADWQRALELLAASEPTGRTPVVRLLEGNGPAARAVELVLVTSRLEPSLVQRLLRRALSRHGVSVVYVDAPTFAGRPRRPEPLLLQLQSAGIPVAVVRAGGDLRAALSARPRPEAVGA